MGNTRVYGHGRREEPSKPKQDGPWGSSEDDALKHSIRMVHPEHRERNFYSDHKKQFLFKWSLISTMCSEAGCKRDAKQCRERWVNHLDPKLDHSPITEEEGRKICDWYIKYGGKWAKFGRWLNKPENTCKNYWNQKKKKADTDNKKKQSVVGYQQQPPSRTNAFSGPRDTYNYVDSSCSRRQSTTSIVSNPGLTHEAGSPVDSSLPASPSYPIPYRLSGQMQLPSSFAGSKSVSGSPPSIQNHYIEPFYSAMSPQKDRDMALPVPLIWTHSDPNHHGGSRDVPYFHGSHDHTTSYAITHERQDFQAYQTYSISQPMSLQHTEQQKQQQHPSEFRSRQYSPTTQPTHGYQVSQRLRRQEHHGSGPSQQQFSPPPHVLHYVETRSEDSKPRSVAAAIQPTPSEQRSAQAVRQQMSFTNLLS